MTHSTAVNRDSKYAYGEAETNRRESNEGALGEMTSALH